MSEHLRFWEKVDKPPTTVLKPIQAGRLKGKSDINPQWRLKAITELFGPCGIGWKYTIDKLWTEPGSDNQTAAFALISLCIREEGEWSAPIPGIGGAMLVEQESRGLHTSDEAYKMAVTDALSVAMKSLGVAAEIYMGNFDGSKYVDKGQSPKRQPSGLSPLEALKKELRDNTDGSEAEMAILLATATRRAEDGRSMEYSKLDTYPPAAIGAALGKVRKYVKGGE